MLGAARVNAAAYAGDHGIPLVVAGGSRPAVRDEPDERTNSDLLQRELTGPRVAGAGTTMRPPFGDMCADSSPGLKVRDARFCTDDRLSSFAGFP